LKKNHHQVEKIIKHPRYSQTNFDNDIALLKLEKPVKFEGVLNPICMPKTGEWYTGYDVSILLEKRLNLDMGCV
jgi:hypothetical protein